MLLTNGEEIVSSRGFTSESHIPKTLVRNVSGCAVDEKSNDSQAAESMVYP